MNVSTTLGLLLKNKQHIKALEYIEKEDNPNIFYELYKWTPVLMLLISSNNMHILSTILTKYPKCGHVSVNGLIPFHLIYEYGHVDLIKQYVKENPHSMNAFNRNGINFIGMIVYSNDHELLEYAISISKSTSTKLYLNNIITTPAKKTNILELAIEKYINNINDKNKTIHEINLLLEAGCSTHIQYDNDLLNFVTKNVNDIQIYTIIRKHATNNAFINDTLFLNAILRSTKTNMELANYIMKNEKLYISSNCVYAAIIGNLDPIISKILPKISIGELKYFRNIKQSSLLLSALISRIDYENIYYLINICDINQKNIFGVTPLHVICLLYTINHFKEILSDKLLNIFAKDNNGSTPLDLVGKNNAHILIEMFVRGYKKHYKINTDNIECLKNINKHIFNEKKCLKLYNPVSITKIPNANTVVGYYPIFPFAIVLYYFIAKKNIKNIYIPSIGHISDIFINDEITNNTFFCAGACTPYSDKVSVSYETFKCPGNCIQTHNITNLFSNYRTGIILWENSDNNVINKDFIFYFIKALMQPQRYIVYSTSIKFSTSWHANVILYDKVKRIIERFDSNAVASNIDLSNLDAKIHYLIQKGVQIYENNDSITIGYDTTLNNIQACAEKYSAMESKYGDPLGFCLAWSLWFIDTRIQYPDLSLNEFMDYASENIKSTKEKNTNNNLLTFIRNYTNNLNEQFSNLCIIAKIPPVSIYETPMPLSSAKKIASIVNNIY